MRKLRGILEEFFLPLILLFTLGIAWGCGGVFPTVTKSFFYAVSLTIKQGLMALLPGLVAGFMFVGILKIGRRALGFILCLVPAICLSNGWSTQLAYGAGYLFVRSTGNGGVFFDRLEETRVLAPLWDLHIRSLLGSESALILGMGLALLGLCICPVEAEKWARWVEFFVEKFLKYLFIPVTPLFIFGFALKLQYEGILSLIFTRYSTLFLTIVSVTSVYILSGYWALSRCSWRSFVDKIRHMMPAFLMGITTMSSAAALPLTLMGVRKNTEGNDVVNGVVPATVNVHLVGDCFAIPLMAFGMMEGFGMGFVPYGQYVIFSLYFVLAKFAVAAVPGGGILVMLPILEKYLGFSPDMLSLMMVLYMIFDPFITGMNILGNGVFGMGFSMFFKRVMKPA